MNIILILILLIITKSFINTSKLLSARHLRKKYHESFTKNGKSFSEYIPQAKKLFIEAGFSQISIPVIQPLGYGKLTPLNALIVDNLDSKQENLVTTILTMFDELVGVYRMRLLESISPRYWIEAIVFLPRHIAEYLGKKPDSFPFKLIQVLYWFITPFLIAFRTKIYHFITELIGKMQ